MRRSIEHLAEIVSYGRALNHRLLEAEKAAASCLFGLETADNVFSGREVEGQRVPPLRFGDPRAMALEAALCTFASGPLKPNGFRAQDLRASFPNLSGTFAYSSGQTTYDLRRLRLRGFIERIPKTHRYRITPWGLRTAFALVKLQQRILPKTLALDPLQDALPPTARRALSHLDRIYDALVVSASHAS